MPLRRSVIPHSFIMDTQTELKKSRPLSSTEATETLATTIILAPEEAERCAAPLRLIIELAKKVGRRIILVDWTGTTGKGSCVLEEFEETGHLEDVAFVADGLFRPLLNSQDKGWEADNGRLAPAV